MSNFWEKLPKPFFALAPMADVTDPAFRRIVADCSRHGEAGGGPDVFWTEFVSADGLASPGREALKRDLEYTERERPIVAQLFSSHPDKMREAAKLCAELGFDGVDINMGCPDRSIEKQGAGAAMIKTPEIASAIIQAAKDGIKDAGSVIPVSVKTRVGYNSVQIESWIPHLFAQGIAALTVHARTRKEMSKVPARWEHIRHVVAIRDRMKVKTKIIGNGDVMDIAHGEQLARDTNCDGIMIGRAVFGNPWIFDHHRVITKRPKKMNLFLARILPRAWMKKLQGADRYTLSEVSIKDKLETLVIHTQLFEQLLGDVKNFSIMKKHYKAYVNGFNGAKELRVKLMETSDAREVETVVKKFFVSVDK
jgi:nifR3 family TIM-barrel protein